MGFRCWGAGRRVQGGVRVVHLGRSTCHAISGREDKSTRMGVAWRDHDVPIGVQSSGLGFRIYG